MNSRQAIFWMWLGAGLMCDVFALTCVSRQQPIAAMAFALGGAAVGWFLIGQLLKGLWQ